MEKNGLTASAFLLLGVGGLVMLFLLRLYEVLKAEITKAERHKKPVFYNLGK